MDPEHDTYKQIEVIVSLYYLKNMRWSIVKKCITVYPCYIVINLPCYIMINA